MIFAGIDAGSRAIKLVLIDETMRIVGSGIVDQGIKQGELAEQLLRKITSQSGLTAADIAYTVATGYGRNKIHFAQTTVTEITCHANGVYFQEPGVKTIIDIGGQDSKLLRLEHEAKVRDFVMNDRCAAGTGRFLEIVASRLDCRLDAIGDVIRNAAKPSPISSMCVVFAETEIISLLADGESPENIIAGVQNSIASRVASMAGRKVTAPVVFTGGVALIPGMCRALETALNQQVKVTAHPQMTGALGAAILAKKRHAATQ